MQDKRYLDDLMKQKLFRFNHLSVSGVDNEPVAKVFSSAVLEQETCLFANSIKSGDDYCNFLHRRVIDYMQKRQSLPIVRFADGEYAFYNLSLDCNGLYRQAESVEAIKNVLPAHIEAMKYLSENGFLAPLVYSGNAQKKASGLISFFKPRQDSSGADFLDFIRQAGISINGDNYVPFYVVYAYLTSVDFARAMNCKNVTIVNSDYNENKCREWFAQFGSLPNLDYVKIPAEYMATRWGEIKELVLNKVSPQTDICLVGAGVGALFICKDIAEGFSIPAIDAGHVLNMMNGRVDKSNGARLYTLRK